MAPRMIVWPTEQKRIAIRKKFAKYGHFRGTIGAIDGTYVPIKAPKVNPEVYINRKCFHGVTLQAIVTSDLKFSDCFAGFPSSVSDVRIFQNSNIFEIMNESPSSLFSQGDYILGDEAYPDTSFCVPPFIERRNFGEHKKFNYLHARTRQIVERSFSLLFGRFRRLNYLNMSRADLIPATIIACCVLHNACLCDVKSLDEHLRTEANEFQNNSQSAEIVDVEINFSMRNRIFQNFVNRRII